MARARIWVFPNSASVERDGKHAISMEGQVINLAVDAAHRAQSTILRDPHSTTHMSVGGSVMSGSDCDPHLWCALVEAPRISTGTAVSE